MINLDDFTQLLEEALSTSLDTLSLDEKIMTKRQARKQRQRAKKAAEQQAQQAAQQAQQNNENPQQNTEQPEENTQEENNSEENNTQDNNNQHTQIIEYRDVNGEQQDFSPYFKELMGKLSTIGEQYSENVKKANDMWKAKGTHSRCPQEAWDLMNTSLQDVKQQIDTCVNNYLTQDNEFTPPELDYIDKFITAVDGYIEKQNQTLTSIKPDLSKEDIENQENSQSTEVATTTGTDVEPVDTTALTTTTGTEVATTTGTQVATTTGTAVTTTGDTEEPEEDEFIDYETYIKETESLEVSYRDLIQSTKNVEKLTWKQFAVNIADMSKWFNPKTYVELTSPLAQDIVKTFMYMNPLTKLIYDGSLLKIKLNAVNEIKKWYQQKLQKWKKETEDLKGYLDEKTKLPTNIVKGLTLEQYESILWGNKYWCGLLNVEYNHKDVKVKDKIILQNLIKQATQALDNKNINQLYNTLQKLLKLTNTIRLYLNYEKYQDWFETEEGMGNDQKTWNKLDKRAKKKQQTTTTQQQVTTAQPQAQITTAQESFDIITRLQSLLEEAEK